jgi:hypothetical protein
VVVAYDPVLLSKATPLAFAPMIKISGVPSGPPILNLELVVRIDAHPAFHAHSIGAPPIVVDCVALSRLVISSRQPPRRAARK